MKRLANVDDVGFVDRVLIFPIKAELLLRRPELKTRKVSEATQLPDFTPNCTATGAKI